MEFINKQVLSIIHTITKEIEDRQIDIFNLCDRLVLEPNEFIDILSNPRNNLSLYIEILEEVRNERDS